MNYKHYIPLLLFLIGFTISIYLIQNTIFLHDIQHIQNYYAQQTLILDAQEPPIIYSLFRTLNFIPNPLILIAGLSFAIGLVTTYHLINKRLNNFPTAFLTSLLFFSPLSLVLLYYGYVKQLLAISLTPLVILLLYEVIESGDHKKQLMIILLLSIIGLTHEISFACIITFYLGLLIIYRSRTFLKRTLPIILIVIGIVGIFYAREIPAITYVGGENGNTYAAYYDMYTTIPGRNYTDPLLFSITIISVGVILIQKNEFGEYLLIYLITNLILTLGWVAYQDRFEIQLIIPMILVSSYGIKYVLRLFISKDLKKLLLVLTSIYLLSLLMGFLQERPDPVILHDVNLLILPISLISMVFSGLLAVILKFIIGVPLTVFLWVRTTKYLYYRLYRLGRGE